jgi:hypothetical protein
MGFEEVLLRFEGLRQSLCFDKRLVSVNSSSQDPTERAADLNGTSPIAPNVRDQKTKTDGRRPTASTFFNHPDLPLNFQDAPFKKASRIAGASGEESQPLMSRESFSPIRPNPISDATESPLSSSFPIERLADLIAKGRGELPSDLADVDRIQLITAIRQRLRQQMIFHISQALAVDLKGRKL